jgi:chromate transporter
VSTERALSAENGHHERRNVLTGLIGVFLRLGCTSFGGPVAHLGYFRAEFVERRRWLTDQAFADLVALCQFLPGPASSQVGFGIGLLRGGIVGGVAAWAAFTLPSAILMLLFAYGVGDATSSPVGAGALHGLKLVAVAIVAQAVLGMARALCPDRTRASLAALAIILMLLVPGALGQIGAILLGGIIGLLLCRDGPELAPDSLSVPVSRTVAYACLALFFMLLAVSFAPPRDNAFALFNAFYRSGALVFGGGHVVLPLLHNAVVTPGWVSDNQFLAGYGAAQALPGPLFTFSAYLGAVADTPLGGITGAVIALLGISLPGLLTLLGTIPFWDRLRSERTAQAIMRGVNAAVVGLLGAALYNPVWTSAVQTPADFAVAVAAFVLLVSWRAPPLLVVLISALAGIALVMIHPT